MTCVPVVAAIWRTLVTSATFGRRASSVRTAATSAGELVWATSSSGPLKPGPNPSASRSYACRVVVEEGRCPGRTSREHGEDDGERGGDRQAVQEADAQDQDAAATVAALLASVWIRMYAAIT